MDGKGEGGITSLLDLFHESACYGMTPVQVGMYYAALAVGFIVLVLVIRRWIPDSLWSNCNVCSGPKHNQVCRKGEKDECRRKGAVVELVIGGVLAALAISVVRFLFLLFLKVKVYNPSAILAEGVVRTFS